jgi:hypothetical protein
LLRLRCRRMLAGHDPDADLHHAPTCAIAPDGGRPAIRLAAIRLAA